MTHRGSVLVGLSLVLCLCGCTPRAERHAALTEHQRDSVISKSVLPGAAVVGRAMELQGKADQHSATIDSVTAP